MGLFMKNQQAVLTPQSPPIGIFPQFAVQGPTTLVLKEKVWSWSGVSGVPAPGLVISKRAMVGRRLARATVSGTAG